MKNRSIVVKGTEVSIASRHEQDYIALTDMVKNFDGGGALIEQWLKNKDTVLFLGVWEQLNNPAFNSLEFEGIRNEAGRNSFFLSAKKWIEATGAVGIYAKAGRYGGTYAHKDIAFGDKPEEGGQTMNEPTIIGPKSKTEIKFAESLAAPLLEATQAYLIKTGKERK